MKMKFRHAALALLCITGLAACGGGGGDGNSSASSAPPPQGPPPADARNGSYLLFATNGQQYVLAVDFDQDTYTVTGTGLSISGSLKNDDSTNTSYSFENVALVGTVNNAHVQYNNGLLVGGFNFGTGVVPFVGDRTFLTDVGSLNGKYIHFGVQTTATGVQQSRIFATSFGGALMKVCNSTLIDDIDSCPAASVLTYSITGGSGGVFTATSSTETITFRAAQYGPEWIFLRTDLNSIDGTVFRIGFPTSAGLVNAKFSGESNQNEALTVTTSTATGPQTYDSVATESNGTTQTTHGTLLSVTGGPSGLSVTNVSTNNGPTNIFAMTTGNLGAFIGADAGPLAGYIVIGAH